MQTPHYLYTDHTNSKSTLLSTKLEGICPRVCNEPFATRNTQRPLVSEQSAQKARLVLFLSVRRHPWLPTIVSAATMIRPGGHSHYGTICAWRARTRSHVHSNTSYSQRSLASFTPAWSLLLLVLRSLFLRLTSSLSTKVHRETPATKNNNLWADQPATERSPHSRSSFSIPHSYLAQ